MDLNGVRIQFGISWNDLRFFRGAFDSGHSLHWHIGQEDGGFGGPKIPTAFVLFLSGGKSYPLVN